MKPIVFEDILIHFSKSLIGKDNEEDVLWELVENCISQLGFVDCSVYMVDETRTKLMQKAASGEKNARDRGAFKPVVLKLGDGIIGHVALSGNPEVINDTSKDARYVVDDVPRLSKICVPFRYESEILGVIDCEHPERNFFTAHHLKMLSVIASICAVKIKSLHSTQNLLLQQHELLKIREEVVDLKLKALNSQLHPHFVFNVINAIQSHVTNSEKKEALDQLSTFSKLLRFHLKYLEYEIVPLFEEIEMLDCYLSLQQFRYSQAFQYRLKLTGDTNHAVVPASILLTLFENLIEYSIYRQHVDASFLIHFNCHPQEITVQINLENEAVGAVSDYTPEYRKEQMKWESQIKLLNEVKGYNIKKEVLFSEDQRGTGSIRLSLPNLV